MLASLSPRPADYPTIVVLTPGIYNSAYFEHSYLAQQMGVELVAGSDLFVGEDDCVYMRTINGRARVDVIYRELMTCLSIRKYLIRIQCWVYRELCVHGEKAMLR